MNDAVKEARAWYEDMGRATLHGAPPFKTFAKAMEHIGDLLMELDEPETHPEPPYNGPYWNLNEMMDFVEAARGKGLSISMGPSENFMRVSTAGRHKVVVRFWWDGRVDTISGVGPNFGSPEWLEPGDPSTWYECLGMERPRG